MAYLVEPEFRRQHARWHKSPEARKLKQILYKRQGGLCARCGKSLLNWRRSVLNLTDYEGMKRGHVNDADANLLHWGCHPKGTYTWEKLAADKAFDREMRIISGAWRGFVWLVWRLFLLFRWLWRAIAKRVRARRSVPDGTIAKY